MTYDLVTVVIPTFNRLEALRRTVSSVFSQNYPLFEVVVVDDASTQSGFEEFARLDRVRVIRIPQRRGPSYARNLGILSARGTYVWFLDSDVLLPDPGTMQRLVSAYGLTQGIGSLGGEIAEMGGDRAFGRKIRWHAITSTVTAFRGEPQWKECDYLATCNCFASKRLLEEVGGFDESFVFGAEDMDLGWRLRQLGLKNFVGFPFAVYHCHESTGRFDDEGARYDRTRVQWAKKHFGWWRLSLLIGYELFIFARFYAALPPKLVYKLLRRIEIRRGNFLRGWDRLKPVFTVPCPSPVSMLREKAKGGETGADRK